MSVVWSSQPQIPLRDPDRLTRIGGWLFERRTLLPIPLALPLLLVRVGEALPSRELVATGTLLVALGEIVRLWSVRHIGAISRTRSDRLGPLVVAGPFALVRNPLYLGNFALWVGFALLARLLWMVPVVIILLGLEYHAIVRWEERLLESRLGDRYRTYAARVPRWMPTLHHGGRDVHGGTDVRGSTSVSSESSVVASFSWRVTLFSERGTLIAIALGSLALWIKLGS
jgi:protein-S-isoprenylcysteine O-methyltransferase Ste14